MMLHLNYTDVDVFGCPPGYISFESNKDIYKRNNKINPLSFVPSKDILNGLIYLGGNTIGGKKCFLLQNPYPEKTFTAADTSFLLEATKKTSEVLIMDLFNILVIRRLDTGTHTWRMQKNNILKNTQLLIGVSAEELFI
ncbi:hypothetical protein BMETH_1615_0 [methanotrophic bacterial endosymbiont of Bathymodiolus sp.]|nr:hypothetical protein BMETH_1615_0 [methanotrophic bacterial endosymbiont of Bathymodiolus sp.]